MLNISGLPSALGQLESTLTATLSEVRATLTQDAADRRANVTRDLSAMQRDLLAMQTSNREVGVAYIKLFARASLAAAIGCCTRLPAIYLHVNAPPSPPGGKGSFLRMLHAQLRPSAHPPPSP